MATHSSVLAWRIPGTGEPRGLPSVGSHRVRHDLSDLAAAAAKGNQPWMFIERTGAEADPPILPPPDAKNWLTRKDPDAGKIEGRRRRRQQKIRCLDGITKSMDMSLSKPEACFILLKHVSQYIKLQCKCFWVRKRELISLLYFLSFLKLTLKSVLFFLVSL